MAYDTQELHEQALSAIEEHNLFFITDVIACLPCSSSTFYDHELEKSEDIRKALQRNVINAKIELRKKWLKSNNGTMQMGIMKLLSTDDELRKLSLEHKQHSGEVKLPTLTVEIVEHNESE